MRVVYPGKIYETDIQCSLFESKDEIHLEHYQDVFEYMLGGKGPTSIEYLYQGLCYFGHQPLLERLFNRCRKITTKRSLQSNVIGLHNVRTFVPKFIKIFSFHNLLKLDETSIMSPVTGRLLYYKNLPQEEYNNRWASYVDRVDWSELSSNDSMDVFGHYSEHPDTQRLQEQYHIGRYVVKMYHDLYTYLMDDNLGKISEIMEHEYFKIREIVVQKLIIRNIREQLIQDINDADDDKLIRLRNFFETL